MKAYLSFTCFLAASLALAVATPASAEEVALVPRHRPGDAYVLSLRASTETNASSGGSVDKRFHEETQVDYGATVVILEVDAEGSPVQERHEDVSMVMRSTRGSGSLFEGDTTFEVHRHDGEVSVFFDGRRADPKQEKAIVRILETQFEHTLEPSLLDPGRPVKVGETWELDRSLARELLRQRGVRVVEFGEPATATLVRRADDDGSMGLEIDYRIPVSWLHVDRLFPGALAGETEGSFGGTIRLASGAQGLPIARTSSLTLNVNGMVTPWGQSNARPYPWTVRSAKVAEQTAAKVETARTTANGPGVSDGSPL